MLRQNRWGCGRGTRWSPHVRSTVWTCWGQGKVSPFMRVEPPAGPELRAWADRGADNTSCFPPLARPRDRALNRAGAGHRWQQAHDSGVCLPRRRTLPHVPHDARNGEGLGHLHTGHQAQERRGPFGLGTGRRSKVGLIGKARGGTQSGRRTMPKGGSAAVPFLPHAPASPHGRSVRTAEDLRPWAAARGAFSSRFRQPPGPLAEKLATLT